MTAYHLLVGCGKKVWLITMGIVINGVDTFLFVGLEREVGGIRANIPNLDCPAVKVSETRTRLSRMCLYRSRQAEANVFVSFGLNAMDIT